MTIILGILLVIGIIVGHYAITYIPIGLLNLNMRSSIHRIVHSLIYATLISLGPLLVFRDLRGLVIIH